MIHAARFNHHSTLYGPEIIHLDVIDLNCSSIQIITSSQISIKSSVTRLSLCFCGKLCFHNVVLFFYHREFASYFIQKINNSLHELKQKKLRNIYLANYSLKANQFTPLRYLFILTYAYAHYHITVKSRTTKLK